MHKLTLSAVAITLAITCAALTGCASKTEQLMSDQLKAEELRQEAIEKQKKLTNEKLEEKLSIAPDWLLSPPKADSTGVYGVSTASSKDLGFVLRKARLLAIYEVAKNFKQEVSGQERSLQRDEGSEGDIADRTEMIIDSLVAQVPVQGYDIVEQQVKAFDGKYQAFVMIKLPYDEFNKVMQQQKNAQLADEFKTTFDKFEQRLKDRAAEGASPKVSSRPEEISPSAPPTEVESEILEELRKQNKQ